MTLATTENLFCVSGTSPTSFRGAQLLSPIPFSPTSFNGQTPSINLTSEEIQEFEVVEEEKDEDTPIGFAANFGTGQNSGSFFPSGREKARSYKKAIPEWTFSNSEIQKLIRRSFPNWQNNPRQQTDAERWAMVINLYYRNGYTFSQVAEEMCSTPCKIRGVIRSIQRAAAGLQANSNKPRTNNRGKNPLSRRKPGKPQII